MLGKSLWSTLTMQRELWSIQEFKKKPAVVGKKFTFPQEINLVGQ
jgi:hypothetical protein